MALLKVTCINTYKIILRVTIFKFRQQTQHSIFLLNCYDSVDLIKVASPSEEARATVGDFAHVEWHPSSMGSSKAPAWHRGAQQTQRRGAPHAGKKFLASLFSLDRLKHFFKDITVSCRKGSFTNYFKSWFILKSLAVSMAHFLSATMPALRKTSSQKSSLADAPRTQISLYNFLKLEGV